MRGSRLPTAVLKLQGTKRPWDIKQQEMREPKPELLAQLPPPPEELTEDAKAHWREVTPHLLRCGLLSVIDLQALTALCENWSIYRHATAQLANSKLVFMDKRTGAPKVNPFFDIQQRALQACQKQWKAFGMTPASRAAIEVDTKFAQAVDNGADPWLALRRPPGEVLEAELDMQGDRDAGASQGGADRR